MLPAPLLALKPSTWLAGRNAGGDDARTARERLAKAARGHRTRSTFRMASGKHPSGRAMIPHLTDTAPRGTLPGGMIPRGGSYG